jgi:DNA-binding MarR family transcriptional regulator
MGEILKNMLKMKRQPPVREELSLNLAVGASILRSKFEKLAEQYKITGSQYNVLRILKGVYPQGHPRCEIILRMVDKAPDITRLIDRLEKQDLVKRDRTSEDRRMSITVITEKGLKLLSDIQPAVDKAHREMTKGLTDGECKELSMLIEKLYRNLV